MSITARELRKALRGLDGDVELSVTQDDMDPLRTLLYCPTDGTGWMSCIDSDDGAEHRDIEVVAII